MNTEYTDYEKVEKMLELVSRKSIVLICIAMKYNMHIELTMVVFHKLCSVSILIIVNYQIHGFNSSCIELNVGYRLAV